MKQAPFSLEFSAVASSSRRELTKEVYWYSSVVVPTVSKREKRIRKK
jgi:hypothetical protein